MISTIKRPDHMVSMVHSRSFVEAAHWCNAARYIGIAATFVAAAALTGCGASSAHKANDEAQAASSKASVLLAQAGGYHPKANFPVSVSAPLSSDQLTAAIEAAKNNPGAYLQTPSASRDLRHAYARLSNALSNSNLNFHFKGVLKMQRGLVNLAAAQEHVNQVSVAILALQNQVLAVDSAAIRVGVFSQKIAFLKKQQDQYLHLYDQELQTAQEKEQSAAQAVTSAQEKAAALNHTLTHFQGIVKALNNKGMLLQTEGETTVTPATLADFKQGAQYLNRAAAANQKAIVLQLQYHLAQIVLQSAVLEHTRRINQVTDLRQAQKSASQLAHSDAAQMVALNAGSTVLIDGGEKTASFSVAGRSAEINKLLKTIATQSDLAQQLTDKASADLTAALTEQRRSSAYAQNLTNQSWPSHFAPSDPLVVANQNHAPECVLEVYRAAAALKAGQIATMNMYAAELQQDAAKAGNQIFAVVNQPSPLQSPADGAVENFRKQALVEFNTQAAGMLKQAQSLYPMGSSSFQWIVPAMLYNVDLSVAAVTSDPATRAAALKAAAQYAQEAQKANASLNLPLPKD